MFQKTIAAILIIGLVLSVNFNLFIFKPKQAQALADVIGGPSNVLSLIKDYLLDAIGHTITQRVLTLLEQKIMDWGQGRKSTANVPFQVTDWVQFFRDAVNIGAAKFISEYEGIFDLSGVCDFQSNLKNTLDSLGFNLYPKDRIYSQYARPTLENTLTTLGLTCQEFTDSGYSLAQGGWGSWFALMEPQNNIFGQAMMAEQEKYRQMMEEKEAADKETAVSSGVRNETTTTATDIDQCVANCAKYPALGAAFAQCTNKCSQMPGFAIHVQIKNWGSDINKMMTNALGADMNRIINTDEITELLGVLFSAITNKAVNMGLAFGTSLLKPNQATRQRAQTKTQFSYQRVFKKEQTIEDIKDVRSQTLNNILKSVQQLSRSIVSCKEEEMMKIDDYAKNLFDIMSPSVEALYIGLEGANLKPDFEVLDPRFAPYTVFGYSWGKVPASKFPDKCKAITDQLALGDNATCRSIQSGLEPNIQSQCQACMYDHDSLNCPPAPYPPQTYPKTGQEPWTETVLKQKSDYWWGCKNQYSITLDRCDECIKKADEKCGKLDGEQKNQCILDNCSNYSDITAQIAGSIADGLDFYNKCLKEEKKDACYTCLKEYFMPATYCDQTQDYMARSIVKYPALVKMSRDSMPWWTNLNIFAIAINIFIGDDKGMFIGPYDEAIGKMGSECNDNFARQDISLSLICRIMPDFKYAGQRVCETGCSQGGLAGQALIDALKDIADFRPNDLDCGRKKLDIGGREPYDIINGGVLRALGKCCGALWQHDAKQYAACVGAGTTTQAQPETCAASLIVGETPECYCDDGERPITDAKNLRPVYKCPSGVTCQTALEGWENSCRNSCKASSFAVPDMNNLNQAYIITNAAPGGGVIAVSTSACQDNSACYYEGGNNSCIWPDNYYSTDPGGEIVCSEEVYRSTNSGDCCASEPQGAIREIGEARISCDLSSFAGRNLYLNTYANEADDCKTHSLLCIPCDPSDSGYPDYGYRDEDGYPIDQCETKHPRSWK